jgi:glycerophosphoryl diester phosphodiesterase
VKKFDKQGPTSLSSALLPELYSSNFHMGLDALDASIETLRELLDDLDECDNELFDHFKEEKKLNHNHNHYNRLERPDHSITRNQSYETEEIIIGKRANEMLWLRDMIRQIPEDDIKHAVAHRGFHNPKGRSDLRPLENSLAAFEAAWTNGVHLCECDVALTKDEKLVLAHDSDFSRLSLDPSSDTSNRKVSELTFKELIALTLKNGVRAPLLLDVLRSAHTIGPEAKLIIEIKPGNNQAAMALARLLARHPEYITHVAVIMSFDLWAMHELRGAMERMLSGEPRRISSSPMLYGDAIDKHTFPSSIGVRMPKVMLLTVAHVPADNYELWVDCNDYSPIDG